jgi:hypothetical protein
MIELEVSDENIGRFKLKHFDKLKADELKAYIAACNPKYMKLSDVADLKNLREWKSMEEATNSVENCITVAFGVRNEKSCLVDINERLDDTNVAVALPLTSRIDLCGCNWVEMKPSDILKDHAKVDSLFLSLTQRAS